MTLALDFAFVARVTVAPPLELGATPSGRRRIIAITGGTVEGPRLTGVVLPGGADWQTIRGDGVAELKARYTLKAEDGGLIAVVNRGLRHGTEAAMKQLLAGGARRARQLLFSLDPGVRDRGAGVSMADAHGLRGQRLASSRVRGAPRLRGPLNRAVRRASGARAATAPGAPALGVPSPRGARRGAGRRAAPSQS